MKARFIAPAQQELDKAVERYNGKALSLGDALFDEVVSASQRLCDFPELWPKVRQNIRRCRLKRFPYSLLYRADAEEIVVIAVMHHRRRPDYWRSRLKGL
ncbi:MAG: type II toxin-antitoxin system RelE/ParE family toxin [Rhodomicrobium sp.]